MSANINQPVRLVIRRMEDNAEVNIVPSYTSEPEFLAKLTENIRKSLLPGYYLDYPAKSEGK